MQRIKRRETCKQNEHIVGKSQTILFLIGRWVEEDLKKEIIFEKIIDKKFTQLNREIYNKFLRQKR